MRITILLNLVMNLSALVLAVTLHAVTRDHNRDLAMLARNSFLGSFLPDDAVAAHLARLDAYCAAP